jgi:hypothetical protein
MMKETPPQTLLTSGSHNPVVSLVISVHPHFRYC